MALPATAVGEVRTTGADTNGGFFNSARGGNDYTLQDAAQASGTVSSSGTTVTATTSIFTSDMVGNYITDGTSWFEITVFTSATVVTVDAAPSWTSVAIKVGGALLTIAKAVAVSVASNVIWVKSGTYVIAAGISISKSININGYNSSRITTEIAIANRPVVQINAGSVSAFNAASGSRQTIRNFVVDGNSQTSSNGFAFVIASNQLVEFCLTKNLTSTGFTSSGANSHFRRCVARVGATGTGFNLSGTTIFAEECEAIIDAASAGVGFLTNTTLATLVDCIAASSGGGTSIGFSNTVTFARFVNCTARGMGGDGFKSTVVDGLSYVNCLAYGNGGFGFDIAGSLTVDNARLLNCAGGANTSGNSTGITTENFVTLSADPHTSSTDLSLNQTAGGGAACRNAGIPGVFPNATTTGHRDIGAVQHGDPTLPSINDVRSGTTFNDGLSTGVLVLPSAGNVANGVGFGANGTEFTGTFATTIYNQTGLLMG